MLAKSMMVLVCVCIGGDAKSICGGGDDDDRSICGGGGDGDRSICGAGGQGIRYNTV